MDLFELMQIYKVRNLLSDECKDFVDEYNHLCKETRELKEALKTGDLSCISEELADVIITAVKLGNRLGVNVNLAVAKKTDKSLEKGELKPLWR